METAATLNGKNALNSCMMSNFSNFTCRYYVFSDKFQFLVLKFLKRRTVMQPSVADS
jgi:hypothetical protein